MTMEDTNMLRIFETKTIRKIHGPIKGERWKIRKNEIKDILQGADIVKFIKSLR